MKNSSIPFNLTNIKLLFSKNFLLVIFISIPSAIVAGYFINTNFLTLLLSFCPGGIYEVAVIDIAFNLDPNFVAFHHIIRLLMILFTAPVILKIMNKTNPKN